MIPIILAISTFISTLLGGFFAIRHKDRLYYVMSFTAGVLLAVTFFDIIPELVKLTANAGLNFTYGMVSVVVGFLLFHVLEKSILIHHSHEEEYANHKHPSVGVLSASGLAFHSFLDGVGIGLGFHVSPAVGFVIAIAVIAHDFSDGLNTVTLMLTNHNSVKKSIRFLFVDATAPIIGVASTYFFSFPDFVLQIYLGFFAGFLLYIGASDLLPEAHSKHSSFRMIGLTILGVLFIFVVTRFI